jgi:hypothetical protein
MILPAFLFITHCSHTACLVCQHALFLMLLSQTFGCTAWLVCPRAQPPPMFPFMPHSLSPYALYPDDSHTIVTHPIMLPLHYWPPFFPICDCHVTLGLVYISKAHSLYSLVLISQDFLFSCLNLCELAVGNPSSYLPRPLCSLPSLSHCQDLVKGSYRMSASPLYSTVL